MEGECIRGRLESKRVDRDKLGERQTLLFMFHSGLLLDGY